MLISWASQQPAFRVSPSLSLDLTTGTLDSRITLTRASAGTVWDSSGVLSTAAIDTARFDHNPVTLAAKGLLIEEARTNSFVRSQEIDNASWTKASVAATANSVAAPDGTTTAEKIYSTTAVAGEHPINQNFSMTNGAYYAESIFVKAAEVTTMGISGGQGYGNANYNITGVAINGVPSGLDPVARIVDVGSNWRRASISHSINVTGSRQNKFYLDFIGNATTPVNDGLYWWGVQLETGAFPTSYIPTTSASATRAADIATMTGANFSSWWGAAVGTIAVTATSPASGTRVVWQADDGTANNRITIYTTGTTVMADVVTGGVTQASLNLGTITANTAFKVAMRYGANDFSASLNGAACVTDTAGTVPTVDRARLGADTTGNYLCGTIASLKAYQSGLGDTDLRSLAT